MSNFLSGAARGMMAFVGFVGFGGSPYNAGRSDQTETVGWNARRVHAESAWAAGSDAITARVEDSDRNQGLINGGLDRDVEQTVGSGLRPWPTPIYPMLNKDFAWSTQWGEYVLASYRVWAEDPMNRCDARMLMSLGELERLAYLNYRRSGEVLFEIRKDDRGATNPTNIMLIDPKRIDCPTGAGAGFDKIKNGIEYAGNIPVAAWIRPYHPDDSRTDKGMNEPVRVEFLTATGTPKLILISNRRFIEQMRGVSPLVASLINAKSLHRFEGGVLDRALLEASTGAFITTEASPEEVREIIAPDSDVSGNNALAIAMDWRAKSPLKAIGGMFFRHLIGQEKVTFMPPVTPGNNYEQFRKSNIASISTPMGWSAPAISQDYTGINLSNARAIANARHETVLQNRKIWSSHFNTAIYIAWLEEEVASGRIKIPGGPSKFYTNLSALTNATWIGPGRGTIDPVKEANGRNLEEAANRASPIDHILEKNQYPSEILDQIAYFRAQLTLRGLPLPDYNTKGAAAGEADGGEGGDSASNPADGDKDGIPNEAAKKKNNLRRGVEQ